MHYNCYYLLLFFAGGGDISSLGLRSTEREENRCFFFWLVFPCLLLRVLVYLPSRMLLSSLLCSSMCWGQLTDLGGQQGGVVSHVSVLVGYRHLVQSLPVLSETTPQIWSSRLTLCAHGSVLKECTVCIIWDGCSSIRTGIKRYVHSTP